ncbi:MAG: hypothetical protein FWF81_08035 [Defluviitaleaceae bacterium]|nr:hypothetical protein [Defluviitaleaceae bacterium]
MNKNTMSFAEDSFDLTEHKRAADAVAREKARVSRIRRQVKFGKIMLIVVASVIVLILYYILGVEMGLIMFR